MKKLIRNLFSIGTLFTLGFCNIVNSQTIACGADYNLIICNTGSAMAMGVNSDGQMGNFGGVYSFVPVNVGISDIIAIGAGQAISMALKSDKTVWTWGAGYSGALGNGTNKASQVPVQVTGLSNIKAIAAGAAFCLALNNDGTIKAWGNNGGGALGNGTIINSNIPVSVNSLTNVIAIFGGGGNAFALKSDGTVYGWGTNGYGQLGIGSNAPSVTSPVLLTSLSGIKTIAAGAFHSLFLKNDGTVWATGYNYDGQLGNGTLAYSNIPVQVTGLTGVTAVSAGRTVSIALKSDGTVWAWGKNADNELGNGTTTNSTVPVQVSLLNGITAIACGESTSLALKNDGLVWVWGRNNYGQYGTGGYNNSSVPVQPTGLCQGLLGINVLKEKSNVSVSPNPSKGKIRVVVANYEQAIKSEIEIYNLLGKIIYKSSIINTETKVDLSNQSQGTYLVKIQVGTENYTKKIILQ